MKRYETMMIIDPSLDHDKIDTVVSKYEEMIKEDGEIIEIEKWGKKRLAYQINKKPTGFYVLIKYSAGNTVPQKLINDMNLNGSVLRYLNIVLDKKALKQEELKEEAQGKEVKKEEQK